MELYLSKGCGVLSDLNADKAVAPNGKMRKSVRRCDFFLSLYTEIIWKKFGRKKVVSHGAFTLKKYPVFLRYQKWHLWCLNQNSKTTFIDQTSPQKPHIHTLGTQIGRQKVICLAILLILNILALFSAVLQCNAGCFFKVKAPWLTLCSCFQTFSRSFQCIKDRKKPPN